MLSWLDLPGRSGDEDASSLTASVWLADVSAGFSLTTIGLEVPIAMCREGLVRRFLCIMAVLGPRGDLPAI
jgi:hypothetical protein